MSQSIHSTSPKNIIFMIADGMGVALVSAYREYVNQHADGLRQPCIYNHHLVGQQSTYSFDGWSTITDSAASSTAMATGSKTANGIIGQDKDGQRLESVVEVAKAHGKKTGLVATAEVSHATPAGFGAHVASRNDYFAIADQYFDDKVGDDFKLDVMLGGGRHHFIRPDRNLGYEFKKAGYDVIHTHSELAESTNSQVLGLFSEFGLPMAIDRNPQVIPSLKEMTQSAIKRLDNEQGFFLMVEGSQIDWGAHHHDIVAAMSEIADFTAAFEAALDFAKADGDTLVIATADHATGGMTMGVNEVASWLPEYIRAVTQTPGKIAKDMLLSHDWMQSLTDNIDFTLSSTELNQIYSTYQQNAFTPEQKRVNLEDTLCEIIDRRSNTGWTTGDHTGEDVNVYAFGPGKEAWAGWRENSHTGQQLKAWAAGQDMTSIDPFEAE
ncbi:alkaline phosphatase [Aerococcus kribbianus]|uniref:Alkaline phosphatase n=1 Tax=Aerococcus kribbianus TaxID=2999064 RepID=A0A9X3FVN3_9LACT|nr:MULTISPECIES: alkaline phosphatase [unclassified Aerococcus]MCZ0717777.1 alkaline phosphatase [Aerococcus sp. YH-aer221]MCZ0726064.1 alkaline phosphatase [Aerococcus sp. YH-aer222]